MSLANFGLEEKKKILENCPQEDIIAESPSLQLVRQREGQMKKEETVAGNEKFNELMAAVLEKPIRPVRGRPKKHLKILGKDANLDDLIEEPISIRLKKGVDQAIRLASHISGASVQQIVNEALGISYMQVVRGYLQRNREVLTLMRHYLGK